MSDIRINVKNDGMLGRIGTEGLGQKLIEMSRIADRQQEENIELKKKIDKAIEYIKENATSNYFDKEKNMFRREIDLLEILKGEDKE